MRRFYQENSYGKLDVDGQVVPQVFMADNELAYYGRDGAGVAGFPLTPTDRESIRLVQITLALTRSTETVRLRTAIYLRSFMDEVTTDP